MELAVPSFVFTPGRNFRERTAAGPLDYRIRANPAPPISPRHIAGSDSVGYLICGLSSNFRDFTWAKFSGHNLLSLVLEDQKLFLYLARRAPLIGESMANKFSVCWWKAQALNLPPALIFPFTHPPGGGDEISMEGKDKKCNMA